jgi:predicted negative regulator of RcsB-dependent stress response
MFEKIKQKWWFVALIVVAFGSVTAWRLETRRQARNEAENSARMKDEVKQSLDKSFSGFQLCPLSQPDCNTKPKP